MNLGNTGGTVVPPKLDLLEHVASIAGALANEKRLQLMELLAQSERSVETLATLAEMPITTTSAHLQILKKADLVRTRREATTVYYRPAGDDVLQLYVALRRVGMDHLPRLREAVLEFMSSADNGEQVPVIDLVSAHAGALVLDIRPRAEFFSRHFEGAISIPLDELEERYDELPQGREIVVYCRGQFCNYARVAARWLRSVGRDALATDEGVLDWSEAQMTVDGGEPRA